MSVTKWTFKGIADFDASGPELNIIKPVPQEYLY